MANKVKVSLTHGKALVWNAEDVRILREDYRIVGTLVGCLPRAPRQNVHLGLPVQLMPEETQLLISKGVVELVDGGSLPEPDEKKAEAFRNMRNENYEGQIESFRQDRKREIYRHMSKIREGKKAKKQKLLEEKRKAGEEIAEDEETEEEFDVEQIPIPAIAEDNSMIQTFTQSPWQDELQPVTNEWKYPQSEHERLRCQVFSYLWGRGYYMTGGGKFGGDFLVYPGDPSRFHSFYIAICKPHQEKLTALDIISMGRLGSNVKKTVLLCSVDSEGKVVCTSLQWTGIS
ncbi:tRNA-splicing endonuclease subunit Sen34-like isoform X1 [Haliotis rubra]|uniref:tRNA-splicing endonuclease subunit Sen34-like isoform X1 n=2 Tax=Haliotis rubra TaxID=36100 RepID=UPI001EE5E532|nr:tRNA-splicing endonuclease subunit Sen34-like isoform X1 [Haliotis rubra]